MEDNNNENTESSFLSDEQEEGVSYIKPNVELKLSADKRKECRNIVMEIRKFGISQRQLLYLIQLLSLELENREVMKALIDAIGENREKINISGLVLPDSE